MCAYKSDFIFFFEEFVDNICMDWKSHVLQSEPNDLGAVPHNGPPLEFDDYHADKLHYHDGPSIPGRQPLPPTQDIVHNVAPPLQDNYRHMNPYDGQHLREGDSSVQNGGTFHGNARQMNDV